jgi:phosphatidate cytidylyltransferase
VFSCIAAGSLFTAVVSRIGRCDAPILLPVGVVYIAVALLSIAWLRLLPEAGLQTVLWMASAVVATDVGAYFSGRFIGGPKLAPRISPSKTWSGLAGGVTCAVIAGVLNVWFMGSGAIAQIAILSGLLAVVAQSGDLIESVVKRHFGVKDAGNLIPGHGGVLDRLDGFLTVAPVTGLMTWFAGGSPLKWQ